MERDKRPICAKCGCPAVEVLMTARVRCELDTDNIIGRVVGVGKRMREDLLRWQRQPLSLRFLLGSADHDGQYWEPQAWESQVLLLTTPGYR